jgi:hypothetical protein
VLDEMWRVVRPGGRVLISTPYRERIRYVLCIHCNQPTPIHAHLNSFDEHRLASYLRQGRFGYTTFWEQSLAHCTDACSARTRSTLAMATRRLARQQDSPQACPHRCLVGSCIIVFCSRRVRPVRKGRVTLSHPLAISSHYLVHYPLPFGLARAYLRNSLHVRVILPCGVPFRSASMPVSVFILPTHRTQPTAAYPRCSYRTVGAKALSQWNPTPFVSPLPFSLFHHLFA